MNQKLFYGVGIIAALIIAMILFLLNAKQDTTYDTFATCLTEKGVTMYGAYWCPHCQNQKEMFGDSWQYVHSVECSLPNRAGQTEFCKAAGITGYPTWEFAGGERVPGELTFEALSAKSGCALESDQ